MHNGTKNSNWLNDGEFGWRGLIGLITPSVGFTTEHEWARMMPKGVAFITTRILLQKVTMESLDEMGGYVEDAIKMMDSASVDAVCYGCTAGSMIKGIKYDEEIVRSIEKSIYKPAATMAGSVIKALRYFGINKVTVVTPYPDDVNRWVRQFLEDNGFNVLALEGLQLVSSIEIRNLSPSVVYHFAKKVHSKASGCDGLFISCGNIRTIEILSALEQDLNKPVVSSNQATFWEGLNLLGIKDPIYGYGSLLQRGQ